MIKDMFRCLILLLIMYKVLESKITPNKYE